MTLELASSEMRKKILKNINADKNSLNEGIEALQHWMTRQPHLPHTMDRNILKAVLVTKKNNVEKSKLYIDNYWSARNVCCEFYVDRNPFSSEIQEETKFVQHCTLPKLTPEGYRVTILRFYETETKTAWPITTMKRILMITDVRLKTEAYLAGEYIIIDCKHFTLSHLLSATPVLIRKMVYCLQEVILIRLKGILFINVNSYAEAVINMAKTFTKKKLGDTFKVYREDYPVIYQYIQTDMLPLEYGGHAGKLEDITNAWQKRIESEYEYLTTVGLQKADESKRPKDNGYEDKSLFGVDGNFKRISLD